MNNICLYIQNTDTVYQNLETCFPNTALLITPKRKIKHIECAYGRPEDRFHFKGDINTFRTVTLAVPGAEADQQMESVPRFLREHTSLSVSLNSGGYGAFFRQWSNESVETFPRIVAEFICKHANIDLTCAPAYLPAFAELTFPNAKKLSVTPEALLNLQVHQFLSLEMVTFGDAHCQDSELCPNERQNHISLIGLKQNCSAILPWR